MKCNKYKTKSGKEIRLWQGDCMELMQKDKQWDLAIVDPPYGIGVNSHNNSKRGKLGQNHKHINWDNNKPESSYFNRLLNKSSNQIIWGANHFIESLSINSSCWVVWDKRTKSNNADCELAWTSFETAVKKYEYLWEGYWQGNMKNKQKRIHPTEKPIQLYRWLLTNYAEEGDTILDTHGGSMSLAISCYIEDYELDIIELDEDYYNDAVQRFEEHISQQVLF